MEIDTSVRNARILSLVSIAALCATGGCSQTMPDRTVRMTRGYIYYLDGAGGGRPLRNWSGGVKQGMLDAGYDGAGEMFSWNTGLGVVADQDSSVAYKRSKAAEVAARIQQYRRQWPEAPVTLVGLSAGTALVVFALEALPADCQVDNVILLGASISATHDLTQALGHVRNRMYVFTSEKDAVLAYLVPVSGTADRQKGAESAGLRGFQLPDPASAETRTQYAKISCVGWRPEFEQVGNLGRHTDTVKAPFVQEYIAPLIMQAKSRTTPIATAGPKKVRNPDYGRWESFAAGSLAVFEGYQTFAGRRRSVRMVAKLVSKHADRIVIERTYTMLDAGSDEPSQVQTFVAAADILPQEHPLTSPGARIVTLPAERLTVAGRFLDCEVQTIEAQGQFTEWGRDVACRVYANQGVPGGVVKVSLRSHRQTEPFEFSGQLLDYQVPDPWPRQTASGMP